MGVAVALIYVFQEKLVSGQRPQPLRWPARAAESSARCTRCAAHAALLSLNRPSPPAPSSTCRGCLASPTLTSAWFRSATASMQRCAAGRGGGAKGRCAAAGAAWVAARGSAMAPHQAAALLPAASLSYTFTCALAAEQQSHATAARVKPLC